MIMLYIFCSFYQVELMEGGAMRVGQALGAGRPVHARALARWLFAGMAAMGLVVGLLFCYAFSFVIFSIVFF